jgi:hypothetical protein
MKKFLSPALKYYSLFATVVLILANMSAQAYLPGTNFIGHMPDSARASWEISGKIQGTDDGLAIPFANIALMDAQKSEIKGGGTSCLEGKFSIKVKNPGKYRLRISAVGYETLYMALALTDVLLIDLGTISLNVEKISLGEVLVVAERIKATTGAETTTYFVNRNMLSASNTGTDLLTLVPGVSVDFRKNIFLEGSQEILILVNGVQRDREFVAQIPASRIDKIEVSNHPSARFDGSVSGVINIILTRKKNAGFEGHVNLEIPTRSDEVYLFPAYSFRYGSGKLNFFSSYTGELTRFDVVESYQRMIWEQNDNKRINAMNLLQQKTWSHRFHYGMDYFINERSQLNFYGYYNPFSFEYSGNSELFFNGSEKSDWRVVKKDDDMNHTFFNSLFFKHHFDDSGQHGLTADLSFYNLKGESSNTFSNEETGYFHQNQTLPSHQALSIKVDYQKPIMANLNYETGVLARLEKMDDRATVGFDYGENTFAAYNTIGFNRKGLSLLAGFRLERSKLGQNNQQGHDFMALLPMTSLNYRIKTGQSIRLSYRHSVRYPRFYQLNPIQQAIDPFTLHSGNPFLKPARMENLQLEHSIRFGNQFVSTRVFYSYSGEMISQLNSLNNSTLESSTFNLGSMAQYGLQFTGAFSIGKKTGINPVIRVFESSSKPNALGVDHGLQPSRKLGWHASLSAYTLLPGDITASLIFNYSSPEPDLQLTRFSDPLYFISVEKDLGKGFRAGFVSAIPFAESFAYKGTDVKGSGFSDYSTGEIIMSKVPFWFKINYQFSSGGKRQAIERQREEIESIQRRGF